MARTLRLPDPLDGAKFKSYYQADARTFRTSEPLALFDLDGQEFALFADADGVMLRGLMRAGLTAGAGAPVAILGEAGEDMGYDPRVVRCVRIMLLRRCDECGNDYPVNGMVERARCTRCGDFQQASPRFWQDSVLEKTTDARTPGVAEGTNVLAGKHGPLTVQCWGIPPLCRKCFTLLPWVALTQAWQEAEKGGAAAISCACGESYRVRSAPEWARRVFPELALLVGETATEGGVDAAPSPVIFKCPSCLAALQIGGEKRIVHCTFCDSDVYLPDDLWLHFNPATKRARWWMLFRGDGR